MAFLKNCQAAKHSSLFVRSFINEEERFNKIDTKAKMIQIILFRIPTIAGQLSTDNFHYLLSSSTSSLSSKFRAKFCKTFCRRNLQISSCICPWQALQIILIREYYRGKYHCTIDLLFDWFGISCITTDNFYFYLQYRLIQTSQTGGQWYSDTSPL